MYHHFATHREASLFGGGGPTTANMAAWYRFNQGITVATGVSQWNDQSGNSRHLTQATGAKQPTKQGDGSILFDGVDDILQTAAFTLNQPSTIYLLFRQVTWIDLDRIFDGNGFNTRVLFQNSSTPNIRLFAGISAPNNANLAVNTYGVVTSVFNGASSELRVNSGTAVTGDAGTSTASGFTLGAAGSDATWGNIQAKEAILYSVAHTTAQQDAVIAYLNTL